MVKIKVGDLTALSVQEILERDRGSYGCHGGFAYSALRYTEKHGIARESDYPYGACYYPSGGRCYKRTFLAKRWLRIGGIVYSDCITTAFIEEALKIQPIVFVLRIFRTYENEFDFYKKGIMKFGKIPVCEECTRHSMVIVGAGVSHDGTNYYIIRNSYGTRWGLKGYAYMERSTLCRFTTYITYPTLITHIYFPGAGRDTR